MYATRLINDEHDCITVLCHQTHLPVDAVLKAGGVMRSTEDGQLQNET